MQKPMVGEFLCIIAYTSSFHKFFLSFVLMFSKSHVKWKNLGNVFYPKEDTKVHTSRRFREMKVAKTIDCVLVCLAIWWEGRSFPSTTYPLDETVIM